jgi:hypothetical protein
MPLFPLLTPINNSRFKHLDCFVLLFFSVCSAAAALLLLSLGKEVIGSLLRKRAHRYSIRDWVRRRFA